LDEVQNMSQMIVDLMLLDRADAGRLSLQRQPFDMARLAHRVVRKYQILADSKGIRFEITGVSTLPATGDENQLEQVVGNLVDNAIKYTPPGGSVRVNLAAGESRGEVEVVDTGPGIPSHQLPRIFERFYQVDKERAREAGGVGLGLAIARVLAERNGAELAVDSTPGTGSKFTLRLPLAVAGV
jgi:signal transduction histidine kinase